MENNCKYCSWWGIAHNGRICFKCGKKAHYIPTKSEHTTKGYAPVYTPPKSEAVHEYFGLSYASYLVLPRSIMQHMSNEWQNRFVECLEEFSGAVDFDDNYHVTLRDKKGKFQKDSFAQYRRFPKDQVPWRK